MLPSKKRLQFPDSSFLVNTIPKLPELPESILRIDEAPEGKLVDTADPTLPIELEHLAMLQSKLPNLYAIHMSWKTDEMLLRVIMVVKDKAMPINSVFYIPSMPNDLFIEAATESDVVTLIHSIPELVASKHSKLTSDLIVRNFCNFSRSERLKPGRLVRVDSGEFSGDIGQIIHIYEEERSVLVKMRPRIDYEGLEQDCVSTQTRLNSYKNPHYRAPQAFFKEESLRVVNPIIEKGTITFGNKTIDVQIWDSKKFYGRYQYVKFPLSQIITWNFTVPVDVAKTFKMDVFGEEHNIPRFERELNLYLPEKTHKQGKKKISFFPSFESLRQEEPKQTNTTTAAQLPQELERSELPITWLDIKEEPVIPIEPAPAVQERTYTKQTTTEKKQPAKQEKEKQKEKEKPKKSASFKGGDKVVPVSGEYAGIPCIVDSVQNKMVKVSFMSKAVFRIPLNEMTVVQPGSGKINESVESQTEESMRNTPATMSSGHMQPKKPKHLLKEEGIQCSGFSILKPRIGDLAQLFTGKVVCVISETECIDYRNARYPINQIDGTVTVLDEPGLTDCYNKRINVGEKVKLNDERHDGREGTVLHTHNGFVFIRLDDKITSVSCKQVQTIQVNWYIG